MVRMTDLRLVVAVLLLCVGCGQTGPLYLPGEAPPTDSAARSLPSDTQDADDEEDEDAR